jgi:hypothetical protein
MKNFLSDSTMIWLMIVLAFFIPFGLVITRIYLLSDSLKGAVNLVTIMLPSIYFLFLARKYLTRVLQDSAATLLAEDLRPIILYLRSFIADDDEDKLSILQWETQEEILKSVFDKIGNFIAPGKPNEKFPPLGGLRIYLSDEWKIAVSDMMSVAMLVIIRPGNTGGLLWEVECAVQTLQPERLLFMVPSGKKEYERFCSNIQKYFPQPLPKYPGWKTSRNQIKGFIYFDSQWNPRFVTFKKSFLRGSFINSLSRTLQSSLQPVYKQLNISWQPPSLNWIRILTYGFIIMFVIYVLTSV